MTTTTVALSAEHNEFISLALEFIEMCIEFVKKHFAQDEKIKRLIEFLEMCVKFAKNLIPHSV